MLLPYFYIGKWKKKSEGKMKMKETPKMIVIGDVKHLSTQTAEALSYRIVMLSRRESCFGNIPL